MKMTRACKDCGEIFGLWRARCPACGTEVPADERVKYLEARADESAPKKRKRKQKERARDECILCYRRGAKEQCPHCEEPVHRNCRVVHVEACARFQEELREAERRLNAAEKKNRPPTEREAEQPADSVRRVVDAAAPRTAVGDAIRRALERRL
jgi:hypothetical protein